MQVQSTSTRSCCVWSCTWSTSLVINSFSVRLRILVSSLRLMFDWDSFVERVKLGTKTSRWNLISTSPLRLMLPIHAGFFTVVLECFIYCNCAIDTMFALEAHKNCTRIVNDEELFSIFVRINLKVWLADFSRIFLCLMVWVKVSNENIFSSSSTCKLT